MVNQLEHIFDKNLSMLQVEMVNEDLTLSRDMDNHIRELNNIFLKAYLKLYNKYENVPPTKIDSKKALLLVKSCNETLVELFYSFITLIQFNGIKYETIINNVDSIIEKAGLSDSDWYLCEDDLEKLLRISSFLGRGEGYNVIPKNRKTLLSDVYHSGFNTISMESLQSTTVLLKQLDYHIWLFSKNHKEKHIIDGLLILSTIINLAQMKTSTILYIINGQ